MLHVYHSNRLEALFELLYALRESQPLADPLTPETVLVANPGIGRWLNFQIADRAGIAANIDYLLPASFVWQLYRKCLDDVPEKSAFERSALRLRVLGQLDAISHAREDTWLPLQRYITADGGSIGDTKRVQLASRIADVFDQYLVYRPQLLLQWEHGSNATPANATPGNATSNDTAQAWQPALWRRLVESVNEPHRAALWRRFCTLADNGDIDPALLPSQLHLFNVGLLPPSTLDVLVRLANIDTESATDRVSLYFLNPAIDYWADLLDLRRAARERLKLGDGSDPLVDDQIGNPLLTSLGGSGRTLMQLLSERSNWVHDEKFFLPSADHNLLAAVQADLLQPYEVSSQPDTVPQTQPNGDESIQLHQCYSPMREMQALHDRLLHQFNTDDTLTPADVIVMVPDINRYAPVIEAVFGSIGTEPDNPSRKRYIPWSVADRSLKDVSRVVSCVQRLFELPGFNFEATEVMAFASEPAIARRFGFDENALKTLNQWLRDSGVRRTLAGVHNRILRDPVATLHSWDFGLRRLLLGRAMPAGCDAVGETLPYSQVEGQAELLSKLLDLLHALAEAQAKLSESRTPAMWVDVINNTIENLLLPDEDEANALAQLREMLVELEADANSAGHDGDMTHATFAEILRGALIAAERKNHRYLTGRVTFSSMVPLRSVPFRVVCMLGLNDSDFPRQRQGAGFDLIAQHPQPGDRSVRDDDRYLFLEALLSARDELYLSWIYRNPSDNSAREPSVLVSELRDYLNKHHPHRPPRCIEHPLQPFSATLFDQNQPALHTFASEWAPPAEKPVSVSLTETSSDSIPAAQISLEDFQRFWSNPSGWYCRRVLGISLWRDEDQPQDAEPFELDSLSSYHLRGELTGWLLTQPDLDKETMYKWLQRSGALPHGGLGELLFDSVCEEARTLADNIRVHKPESLAAFDIEICVNNQWLQGRLSDGVTWPDDSSGILHHHAAKSIHGKHISALWLAHLVGSAAGCINGKSLLIVSDKERELAAIPQADALARLAPWFEGWNHGQHSALPFFPKTSAALAGAIKSNANTAWLTTRFGGRGESEDEAIHLLYNNIPDIPNRDDVLEWANRLLGDEVLKP